MILLPTENLDNIESAVLKKIPERHELSREEVAELESAFVQEQWDSHPELLAARERFDDRVVANTDLPKLRSAFRRYVNHRLAAIVDAREQREQREEIERLEAEKADISRQIQREEESQAAMAREREHYRALWLQQGGTSYEFDNGGWQQIRQRLMSERVLEADRAARAQSRAQIRGAW